MGLIKIKKKFLWDTIYFDLFLKVNLRYTNSFGDDPDLRINVRLVNILIYTVSIN